MRFSILLLFLTAFISVNAQQISLKFNKNKKFKIVQFTDTHIIAGDTNSLGSIRTISNVLDAEQPDMVVYTGDIVVDSNLEKGWEMVTKPVIDRKIPFAVVFGNHDDELYLNRQQLAAIVKAMPYSLFVIEDGDVTGFGNYVLQVQSSSGSKTQAILYFIDSNAYVTKDPESGYNWIQPDQISWYKQQSQKFKDDNNGKSLPALAFFHIPLPEFHDAYINEAHPPIGLRLEKVCSPAHNSGMFDAIVKSGDVMGVFTGHDHDNDYIAYLKGVAFAYGRFTGSKTTYGVLPNGARVIELKEGSKAFKTWIRTGSNDVLCVVNFPADFLKKKSLK